MEYVKIDSGDLFITSVKLLFVGSATNKSIRYADIIGFNFEKNKGVGIVKEVGNHIFLELKKNTLFAAQIIQHFLKQ